MLFTASAIMEQHALPLFLMDGASCLRHSL